MLGLISGVCGTEIKLPAIIPAIKEITRIDSVSEFAPLLISCLFLLIVSLSLFIDIFLSYMLYITEYVQKEVKRTYSASFPS